MKRLLLLSTLFICAYTTCAQVSPAAVENMMYRRVLNCTDIEYNAMSMIPRLYKAGRVDTLDAVINYSAENCGMYEYLVTLNILRSIKAGTFKEEIVNLYDTTGHGHVVDSAYYAKNILSYLQAYKDRADIRRDSKRYFPYTIVAICDYYDFLKSIAVSLQSKQGMTPVERFLVNYYANPDTAMLRRLIGPEYTGTALQTAYNGYGKAGDVNLGLTAGLWMPMGKLSAMGNHPSLGLVVGGRGKNFMCDVDFNVRFVNTPTEHTTVKNDTLRYGKDFIGYYFGLDMGYSLLKTKKTELAVLGGIAMDAIDIWKNPNNTGNNNNNSNNETNNDRTLFSLNLNAGLGYKVYIHNRVSKIMQNRSYIDLQVKYNYVNYKNAGGSEVTGNAVTFGIVYGSYKKPIHHYYDAN